MHRILALLACLCALVAADPDALPAPATPPAVETAAAKPSASGYQTPVAMIELNGPIDERSARHFLSRLEQAKQDGVGTLVLHLTSAGGRVAQMTEMITASLQVRDTPRLVCFVDDHAYSAGALIAYAHQHVILTPSARIGSGKPGPEPAEATAQSTEKLQSPILASLRQIAQSRGWSAETLERMVLTTVTFTGTEAVAAGMATDIVADLPALWRKLGVEAAQVKILPPVVETPAGAVPLAVPAPTVANYPAPFAVIELDGPIDDLRARFFKSRLEQAVRDNVGTLVLHLTTPGGRVDKTQEIIAELMRIADRPRLVCFVDEHAYSAGAMIAYAHHAVFLAPRAHIGDSAAVIMTGAGQPEYAIEKLASPVRAMFRTLAQTRGWDQAKLLKMTDKDESLYYFDLQQADGSLRRHYVIEEDVPAFLDRNKPLTKKDGVEVLGYDRLLTYTGVEAQAAGMATGIANDLPALWKTLGADPAAVQTYAPTSTEEVSWMLAGIAPILAGLAVLCLVLEFKFGGNGLFLIGAGVLGLLFAGAQYYQEMATHVELILVLIGLALVVLELFVFPTGGFLLAAGLGSAAIGLLLAFMPDIDQFNPSAPEWGGDLVHALGQASFALIVLGVLLLVILTWLPRSRALRRIAVTDAIAGTSEAEPPAAASMRGVAASDLRPAGLVRLDGAAADESARADHGAHIARGTRVAVVERRLGELVVRPEEQA